MQVITRASGVQLRLPDDLSVSDAGGEDAPVRRGRSGLPTGPIPMQDASAEPTAGGTDPVVASLQAQDLTLVDAFEVVAPGPADDLVRRRAPGGAEGGGEITVEVAEPEDAVLLLEQDGVYTWRYPAEEKTEVRGATRRGPVVVPAARVLVFDVDLGSAVPGAPQQRGVRGPVGDFIQGRVRAWVLKFAARAAVGQLMKFLERNTRRGLVVMGSSDPTRWERVEDLAAVSLPRDRPARVLLFVHGTFSSTLGSFGALGAADWGRSFLDAARGAYDLVLGYDHPTLSDDPLENAADLLARLERGRPAHPPVVDAVSFSRGALVLRSLIEYLLPASPLGARVRRAVFVGGTNGGTELAESRNWKRLADLYTNLAVAGCKAVGFLAPGSQVATLILEESLQALGALVKYLAAAALDERGIPGLAAMSPRGDFVTKINAAQPGQPGVADSFYCVVTSDLDIELIGRDQASARELPQRLVQWILDGLADGLMREANDLVVHTASMSQIDAATGVFVKDRLDFGRNPHVYHTIYFTRPEVAGALARWLELDVSAGALPAVADTDLRVVDADAPFDAVLRAVRRGQPSHVVIERRELGETYHYAFKSEELLRLAQWLEGPGRLMSDLRVRDALQYEPSMAMHEWSSSTRVARGAPLPDLSGRPDAPAGRAIIFDDNVPVAVVEPPGGLPSSRDLGPLAGYAATVEPPVEFPSHTYTYTYGGTVSVEDDLIDSIIHRRLSPTAVPPPALTPPPSPPPARERSVPEPSAPEAVPPLRDRFYFAASMPGSVTVHENADVLVAISRDVLDVVETAVSRTASAEIHRTRKLIVQLIAKKNLDVIGDDRVELEPGELGQRTDLVFEVQGTDAGPGEVWVVFRQGPVALATLRLEPQVTGAAGTGARGRVDSMADAIPEPPVDAPFPVLQIFERQHGDRLTYQFVLDKKDGSYRSSDSKPLQGNRDDYVARLYKEIENRWVSSQKDVKAFEREMRAYGGQLLDELVPVDVQQDLWDLRDQLGAIQVVSEEPFIPWEIVHLKQPPPPGGTPPPVSPAPHFLAQKGLVRWLHNRTGAPREIRIREGRAFYVIPDYPHKQWKLPAAQEEIPFLEQRLHARPLEAESNAILDLLEEPGTVDLFHFAGHGEAETDNAAQARILLLGRVEGSNYIPLYLNSTNVQQHARLTGPEGNRPLVVLNACQVGRVGWQLTSIGGFAEAFLRAGAGAFVGSLWSVGDKPARTFTEALYASLLSGRTLAEAACEGREAARAGEATWLAYVVYGHPLATVRLG